MNAFASSRRYLQMIPTKKAAVNHVPLASYKRTASNLNSLKHFLARPKHAPTPSCLASDNT
jgi:hypothetical protein